ncbi:MAG: hypothetical protein J5889_04175 [Clostridia bacterium]|nr:hypothetical protein [Clostridia bacterium]
MLYHFVAFVLVVCMVLCAVPALAEEITLSNMDLSNPIKAGLKKIVSLTGEDTREHRHYHVQQGSCTDGKYAYMILESQTDYKGSLWKVDLTDGHVIQNVYGLPIDHGNDMTYNPKTGLLIVVHNKPNYDTISMIDPETLEIVETRKLTHNMYSITYNETRDQYVIGISGSYNFIVLDADFNDVAFHTGRDTGLVKQGMDCDDRYIYFPQNSKDNSINRIQVYDWEGNYIDYIRVAAYQEIESMFHIGDDLYICFNASGGYLFKATLDVDKAPR